MSSVFDHPLGTTWRKALISLPRLVPDFVLRYTSSEGPQPIVIQLESRGRHKIPVYAFIPPSVSDQPDRKLPVLVDFHGGGFVWGSCQEQAPFCAKVSRELGCVALSVDYRLGPYAQFPAANEDAEDVVGAVLNASQPAYQQLRDVINKQVTALRKAAGQGKLASPVVLDETRIAFSGFSSGGNLALNMALSIKVSQEVATPWPSVIPPEFPRPLPLLLFYPSLDCRPLPSERHRPPGLNEQTGFIASLQLEDQLMPTYLPRHRAGHPRASPGLAELSNGGLHRRARIMLVLPELDSLAEQSEIWIQNVDEEGFGNILRVERFKGMLHGWTQFPDSFLDDKSRELKYKVFQKAVDYVRNIWDGKDPGESN